MIEMSGDRSPTLYVAIFINCNLVIFLCIF